jgi:hypothetical protein
MIKIGRFLYEKSVIYENFLIIPFVFSRIEGQNIYSYSLLSEEGYKHELHQQENPAKLYSSKLVNIINIAQNHLQQIQEKEVGYSDYFSQRYTYNKNLIIIHKESSKCFYEHYPPYQLRNIAAPKLFNSSLDCLNWIKNGLDRRQVI